MVMCFLSTWMSTLYLLPKDAALLPRMSFCGIACNVKVSKHGNDKVFLQPPPPPRPPAHTHTNLEKKDNRFTNVEMKCHGIRISVSL